MQYNCIGSCFEAKAAFLLHSNGYQSKNFQIQIEAGNCIDICGTGFCQTTDVYLVPNMSRLKVQKQNNQAKNNKVDK